jgi:hypothetical protein
LQRFGQPEIVFTLARTRGETLAPPQPIQLFRIIHDFARAGQIVGAGGVTQFGDDKFFGRHLTYIPAQRLPGIAIPSAAICAILVTADEVLAVGQFGSARVTARLGNAARYYPCPPWSDRSRPGIAFAATRRESMLARLETILRPGRGCGIHQADGEIVLRLGESARAALATQLERTPDGKTFGVLTEIEPDADACLVWQPGQSAMAAIAPPGSTGRHICGCMLLIAIGMQEDSVHQTEDGFGVVLTDASWRAVKDAIDRGERLRIAANGMPFVVDCIGG